MSYQNLGQQEASKKGAWDRFYVKGKEQDRARDQQNIENGFLPDNWKEQVEKRRAKIDHAVELIEEWWKVRKEPLKAQPLWQEIIQDYLKNPEIYQTDLQDEKECHFLEMEKVCDQLEEEQAKCRYNEFLNSGICNFPGDHLLPRLIEEAKFGKSKGH